MINLFIRMQEIFINQCIRGAADRISDSHLTGNLLNKSCFAGSKITFQNPDCKIFAIVQDLTSYFRQFIYCPAMNFQSTEKLKIISNLGKLLELSFLLVTILRVGMYHDNNLHNNYNYSDRQRINLPWRTHMCWTH